MGSRRHFLFRELPGLGTLLTMASSNPAGVLKALDALPPVPAAATSAAKLLLEYGRYYSGLTPFSLEADIDATGYMITGLPDYLDRLATATRMRDAYAKLLSEERAAGKDSIAQIALVKDIDAVLKKSQEVLDSVGTLYRRGGFGTPDAFMKETHIMHKVLTAYRARLLAECGIPEAPPQSLSLVYSRAERNDGFTGLLPGYDANDVLEAGPSHIHEFAGHIDMLATHLSGYLELAHSPDIKMMETTARYVDAIASACHRAAERFGIGLNEMTTRSVFQISGSKTSVAKIMRDAKTAMVNAYTRDLNGNVFYDTLSEGPAEDAIRYIEQVKAGGDTPRAHAEAQREWQQAQARRAQEEAAKRAHALSGPAYSHHLKNLTDGWAAREVAEHPRTAPKR